MERDHSTLLDIARAAALIQQFVADLSKEQFLVDLKTQSAVLHQLTMLGEAVKRLSPPFRLQHSILPWSLMAGMRDHLIHAYDVVDLESWKQSELISLAAFPPVVRSPRSSSKSAKDIDG